MAELVVACVLALVVGLLLGWLLASRGAGRLAAEHAAAQARAADLDIVRQARDAVERERNDALHDLAGLRVRVEERDAEIAAVRKLYDVDARDLRQLSDTHAELKARMEEREQAHAQTLRQLGEAREQLTKHFDAAAATALARAQDEFLKRADDRFRQSEEASGQKLAQLLQPVSDRLLRYEEGVAKVEAERRDAFGLLHGQIEAMRTGQERVSSEAAKLVNALRNAPKARGRWGEQQLRNVLESCGLSQHADFRTEVSIADGEGGRLRPDVVVTIPGGKSLVIDAKVSLNAYQDAFGATDEGERQIGLAAHAAAIRAHVNALGTKSYWSQFEDAPEYVVMFVPGEHFVSAALEFDPTLWDFAFDKRVLLATPTNLIAIARTVSAVWSQEKMAQQAREIGALGKELYARLATMGAHVGRLGKNLDTAVGAYNAFVGSIESQVLTSARRFEALNVDTAGKAIDTPPVIEQTARPLTKLLVADAAVE